MSMTWINNRTMQILEADQDQGYIQQRLRATQLTVFQHNINFVSGLIISQ